MIQTLRQSSSNLLSSADNGTAAGTASFLLAFNYMQQVQLGQGAWRLWQPLNTAQTVDITQLWPEWIQINSYEARQKMWSAWQGEILVRRQTREQRIREQRERDLLEAQRDGRLLQAQEANKKAEDLLQTYLTPDQRDQLQRFNFFELITRSGRRYRIRRGTHGNVKLVEQNQEVESLCINPVAEANVPVPDAMLAQKLMLEANEEEFRRLANITRRAA